MKRLFPTCLRARTAALATLLAAPAAAWPQTGGVNVFHGPPGATGDVTTYDETSGLPQAQVPELAGVRLLPIDFNGRTATDELVAGRPRWRDDVPGASRIVLPAGLGGLYRYERHEAGGSRTFGFLFVDAQGAPHPLAEIAGGGPLFDQDPYLARVAIDRDGAAILAATKAEAGGNVLEIELATGVVRDRTSNVPPLSFRAQSLALGEGWGVAVCTRAVLRFARQPGARVQRVPLAPGDPSWFAGEVVLSPGGLRAATIAGAGPAQAHAWVFGPGGAALRASDAPAELSGAGYLPDATGGPFMAVSDDGDLCAWRREGVAREAFLRRASAGPAPVQVTSDDYYIDTLDEVGVLGIFQQALVMAVGEQNPAPGEAIEKADLYQVTLDAGGQPGFVNVTLTSGDATPPFLEPGTLQPSVLRLVPEAAGYLLFNEMSGGTGELLRVQPALPGVSLLLADVADVGFVEGIGNEIVAAVERSNGLEPWQIVRMPRDLSSAPTLLVDGDEDTGFLSPVVRDDGWLAWHRVVAMSGEWIERVALATGVVETFPVNGAQYGPVLGLTPAGSLAFTIGVQGARHVVWPFDPLPPVLLRTPPGPGHAVPGR